MAKGLAAMRSLGVVPPVVAPFILMRFNVEFVMPNGVAFEVRMHGYGRTEAACRADVRRQARSWHKSIRTKVNAL